MPVAQILELGLVILAGCYAWMCVQSERRERRAEKAWSDLV